MAYEKLKEDHYRNLGGINLKLSKYTTEDTEFLDLRNYCFYRPGALVSRPGQEYYAVSLPISTFMVKPSTTIEYVKSNGSTYLLYDVGPTLYVMPNTPLTKTYTALTANVTTSATIDYSIQNNFLYFANGNNFEIFNGTVAVAYYPQSAVFVQNGITFNTSLIPTDGLTAVIASGVYYFFLTPVRALNGQSFPTQYGIPGSNDVYPTVEGVNAGFGVAVTLSTTLVSRGKWILYGFTIFEGFGYSLGTPQYQKSTSVQLAPYTTEILNTLKNENTFSFNITTFGGGVTYTGIEFDHYTLSASWENQGRITLIPKYLETYNNMLFMCGFSTQPSTVLMSEVGEPERIKEENFFEIKTGDNEKITGCIFFQDALLFFKRSSIHEVVGTSPQDLTLNQINNQFGAVNNEGLVVFENRLWFVDDKGICEYNAANIKVMSEPIEEFLSLVDKTKIKALHYKDRSEVWFCADNYCFVYNYFVNAWSINDPISIDRKSGALVAPFGSTTSDPLYWVQGSSFINLVKFNPTLSTDFGSAITLVAKTKYHKRLGDSTQEMWRRFYLDCQSSASVGATVNFYPDYGSSIYESRSMSLSTFQTRMDFGVSAKSLAVEFIIRSSDRVTINGYTIESRYLRSV